MRKAKGESEDTGDRGWGIREDVGHRVLEAKGIWGVGNLEEEDKI